MNGVAALHTELLKKTVCMISIELLPRQFFNVTNGVTPRRWVALSNPELSELISSKIGWNWLTHQDELRKLEPFAEDSAFRHGWRTVKRARKHPSLPPYQAAYGRDCQSGHAVRRAGEANSRIQTAAAERSLLITLFHRLRATPASTSRPER